MADFSINEMQKALQDRYKHKWEPICAEIGQNKLLWMIGEIGEVIDIVKKHGGTKASTDEALRKDLVEEMADVLMYYNDVMLCYGITADELKQAYSEKFEKNMKRYCSIGNLLLSVFNIDAGSVMNGLCIFGFYFDFFS